jgi:hypothetical protein
MREDEFFYGYEVDDGGLCNALCSVECPQCDGYAKMDLYSGVLGAKRRPSRASSPVASHHLITRRAQAFFSRPELQTFACHVCTLSRAEPEVT